MDFFRKKEDVFHQGDVIRFKNSVDTSYHYAIIANLPGNIVTYKDDDGPVVATPVDNYATVILNNENPFYAGDIYRTGESIQEVVGTF